MVVLMKIFGNVVLFSEVTGVVLRDELPVEGIVVE